MLVFRYSFIGSTTNTGKKIQNKNRSPKFQQFFKGAFMYRESAEIKMIYYPLLAFGAWRMEGQNGLERQELHLEQELCFSWRWGFILKRQWYPQGAWTWLVYKRLLGATKLFKVFGRINLNPTEVFFNKWITQGQRGLYCNIRFGAWERCKRKWQNLQTKNKFFHCDWIIRQKNVVSVENQILSTVYPSLPSL